MSDTDMKFEANRLATFAQWPNSAPVSAERIARAGFYYTGSGCEVQCFMCGITIGNWEHGDQAIVRHRTANPQCQFVISPVTSGNVPLTNAELQPSSMQDMAPQQRRDSRPDVDLLRREESRLATFVNWPLHFVRPEELAEAGFFYLREGDKVQCVFCFGIVEEWEAGDEPRSEHRKHFPMCPFINNLPVNNIPLRGIPGARYLQHAPAFQSFDTVNSFGSVIRPFSRPERGNAWMKSVKLTEPQDSQGQSTNLEGLGIQKHRGPRHANYSTYESRMRTFKKWAPTMKQRPEQLAEAGFFYAGTNDQVKCFHCDGGLRNWEPEDDPWMEHARWFGRCAFVLLVKGEAYVKDVIEKRPPKLPPGVTFDDIQGIERQLPLLHANGLREWRAPTGFALRNVTDEEINSLMDTPIVQAALQMGLDHSRVRRAVTEKMRQTGLPFSSTNALAEAALDIQHEEDFESPTDTPSSLDITNFSRDHARWSDEELSDSDTDEEFSSPTQRTQVAQSGENQPEQRTSEQSSSRPTSEPSIPVAVQISKSPLSGTMEKLATSLSLPAMSIEERKDSLPAAELEEENRKLREARQCKICMDEEVGVVFLPCGHLITCVKCAPALHDCPLCRTPIKGTVRTFLS